MNLPAIYAADAKPEPAPTPVVRRREWVHVIDGETVWLPYPPNAEVKAGARMQGEVALDRGPCIIHPEQVEEFQAAADKAGVAVTYRPDGIPVVPKTLRAQEAYYHHRGFYNQDSVFSPKNH